MANRNFDNLQILGKNRKVIQGSFKPNGASQPVVTSSTGVGFTVTHVGGGSSYVITLADAYFGVGSVLVSLQSATLGQAAQLILEPTTAVVFTVGVYTTSTGLAIVDLAAATDTRIHFIAVLKNSSGNF